MDFQILVTLTFKEPGGKDFAMNSKVIGFDTRYQAEEALEAIKMGYPKNAVYATAVRLYRDNSHVGA